MKNSSLKGKFFIFSLIVAYSICIFSILTVLPVKKSYAATASAGESVIEVSSGRVLFERNADKKLPMASTTKILTAIVIIEDCNLEEKIKIPAAGVGIEGSSVYLKADDEYTVKQLLYGLMLRSGNDCAVTLALHHSGSIEAFACVMNERAKSWGATNSNFVNPHGLPNENHYTTANDLAKITAHAMQNGIFKDIVSTKFFKENDWQNKNKMLYSYEGANGVKTGFTKKAGRCLVSSANKNGMQLVCVVLNSPEMYERSSELLDNAFLSYGMEKLYSAEREFVLPTDVENKTCILKAERDFYYPVAKGESVKTEFDLPKDIRLPIKRGENKGKVNIYLENQLIFSENLCTIKDVNKSYADYLKEVIDNF